MLCAVASIKRDQRYGETDAQLDVPGVLRFLNRRHRTGEDPDDGNVSINSERIGPGGSPYGGGEKDGLTAHGRQATVLHTCQLGKQVGHPADRSDENKHRHLEWHDTVRGAAKFKLDETKKKLQRDDRCKPVEADRNDSITESCCFI